MNQQRPSRRNRRRRQKTEAPPAPARNNRWLGLAAVAALAVSAVVISQSWMPLDPRQQFEQAMAAYPNDLARAEGILRKAVNATDARRNDAAVLLGCVLARRGAWDQVAGQLASADLNGARPDLLNELGDLAMAAERSDLAIKVFTSSAGRSGSHQPHSLFMLVLVHRSAGHAQDALQCAEQLTNIEPADVRWWRLVGSLHSQQGDEVQEVETYRRALGQQLPPRDARALRHKLFEQLVHLGDAPAARLVLEELEATADPAADEQGRDRVRLDVDQARLLRLEGRPREALASLDRAMPSLGDVPLAIGLRGTLLMDLAEFPAAIKELSRAVEALPYDEVLHYKLAEAYRRTGQPEPARQHLDKYQNIHAIRLEIDRLEAEAGDRSLTAAERARLAELRAQVGD